MIKDARAFFSDEQVVTETTYSQKAYDFMAAWDHAIGSQLYVTCICNGDFAKDLRVQVIGSTDGKTWDIKHPLGDSGVYAKEDLKTNKTFPIHVVETGQKYRYVTLLYIPSTGGVEDTNVSSPTEPDLTNFAVAHKIGEKREPKANAITAFFGTIAAISPIVRYANSDKFTG